MEKKRMATKEELDGLKVAQDARRGLKRLLKLRSKSQLIDIIIEYSANIQDMQNIAKKLYEENKVLKEGVKDEQ